MDESQYSYSWENDEVKVDIPFSAAGVSTTIIITSRFTGKIMLMDVGDGALRDLLKRGNLEFVDDIDLIAITHGHFDHMGGLYSILGFTRMMKRSTPLNVLIPGGCGEVQSMITEFRRCYRDSIPYRVYYHEVGHGSGFDTDFFKVHALEVEHFGMENITDNDILMPALGFRVRVGQTTIGYTGDTRMCEGAREIVENTDLAIMEATQEEVKGDTPRMHLSIEEAEELARLAKDHLLIHRIPKIDVIQPSE